jgi:hypothetical protein
MTGRLRARAGGLRFFKITLWSARLLPDAREIYL